MKTLKYYQYKPQLICITILIMLCLSCDDFLEQEPGSQTSITELLSTKEGVLMALNGAYSTLESNVRGERYAVYADLQGGNLKFTPIATGSNTGVINIPINLDNIYAFQDDAIDSNFSSFYSGCYDVINQANLILKFVDDLQDATQSEKSQIKAEALSLRAFSHYLLTIVYAQNYAFTANASHLGIIYNKTTLGENISFPSRETLANTYTLIIEDIQTALNFYTSTRALPGPEHTYFNEYSTKALLARIYLSKNDWQNALNVALEVINNSGVSLTTTENYISEWEASDVPMTEILLQLSIPRDSGGSAGGSLSQSFGYVSNNNFGRYVASMDLLELFEPADLRGTMYLQRPLPTLINDELTNVDYFFTKKFQDNPPYPAFRLSEMYLIASEAYFELGQTNNALEFINIIKERANSTALNTAVNFDEEIQLERRRELAFEGFYFFDLARRQNNITRNNGCISQLCNLNYPSPKFVLPIPQSNINLNSNLEQNESY